MNTASLRLRILCLHMRRKCKPSLRHFSRMSATLELTLVALLPRDNIFYVSNITVRPMQGILKQNEWKPHKPYAGEDVGAAKPTVGGACVGAERKKSKSPSKKELFCTVLKTICFLVHFKMEVLNTNFISFFSPITTFTVWKRFYFPFWSNLK